MTEIKSPKFLWIRKAESEERWHGRMARQILTKVPPVYEEAAAYGAQPRSLLAPDDTCKAASLATSFISKTTVSLNSITALLIH